MTCLCFVICGMAFVIMAIPRLYNSLVYQKTEATCIKCCYNKSTLPFCSGHQSGWQSTFEYRINGVLYQQSQRTKCDRTHYQEGRQYEIFVHPSRFDIILTRSEIRAAYVLILIAVVFFILAAINK